MAIIRVSVVKENPGVQAVNETLRFRLLMKPE